MGKEESLCSFSEWKKYGKTWYSFNYEDKLANICTLVKYKTQELSEEGIWSVVDAIELIGSMNELGGFCDDCNIGRDTIIEEYAEPNPSLLEDINKTVLKMRLKK